MQMVVIIAAGSIFPLTDPVFACNSVEISHPIVESKRPRNPTYIRVVFLSARIAIKYAIATVKGNSTKKR